MTRSELKVIGVTLGAPPYWPCRQVRAIVAAESRAAAARAFGVSSRYLRDWGTETFNEEERTVALAHPGVALQRPLDHHGAGGWERK